MLGRFGKLGNITPAYRASGGGGKTYKLFDAWDFSTKNNDSTNPEYLDETCLEELGYGSEEDLEQYRALKDFKELGDALTQYLLEV